MARSASVGASDPPGSLSVMEAASRQRREAVARVIEDAALDLLAERPTSEVTVEEIAASAGVAVRTMYRYFASKDEIFAGFPRRAAERIAECIRARPVDEAPFDAVCNAVREVGGGHDRDELARWLRAYAHSDNPSRIAHMAVGVTTAGFPAALAERTGLEPDDLWIVMACNMVGSALVAATQRWFRLGGDLMSHQLEALEIVGDGLRSARWQAGAGTS